MAYQYVEFDGVPIALFDHAQPHDAMPSESTLIDSIGGVYDWRGSARRNGRRQIIAPQGKYVGETEYLVDETGDRIVDEDDDPLIAGDGETMLLAQVQALMEKKGARGPLWRKRLVDDVLQWKTARLLSVPWPRKWDDHALIAEVTPQFETQMEFWHAATATATSGSATNGVPLGLLVSNSGEIVNDATITVTRTSGTITAFTLVCAACGVSISWTGGLGSGDVLTIDCGARTVRKNSLDAYSGFSLASAHSAGGWVPLNSGIYSFVATVTGGNATVAINHYNQYP